jgi:hypothetical protein
VVKWILLSSIISPIVVVFSFTLFHFMDHQITFCCHSTSNKNRKYLFLFHASNKRGTNHIHVLYVIANSISEEYFRLDQPRIAPTKRKNTKINFEKSSTNFSPTCGTRNSSHEKFKTSEMYLSNSINIGIYEK